MVRVKRFGGIYDYFVKTLIMEYYQYYITRLVEYCTWGGVNTLLVKEKGLYTSRWVDGQETRKYFDVYVREDSGLKLLGSKIARFFLENKYPYIFKNLIFTDKVKPYADECIFHIRRDTKLTDIEHIIHTYSNNLYGLNCEYSVQDLIDVLEGNTKTSETKSKFSIYYDDINNDVSIYLKLDTDISLTIPFNAIVEHKFDPIRKQILYNIPLGDNKFYNGLQEDAPYFDNELVKQLEEIFNTCKC